MEQDNYNRTPPVEVGEDYNLTILGHGKNGDPFDKIDGYIIFIKLPQGKSLEVGDKCKVKITTVNRSIGFAEVQNDL